MAGFVKHQQEQKNGKKDSKRTQAQFKKDYENRFFESKKSFKKGKNKSKIISTASADSNKKKKAEA